MFKYNLLSCMFSLISCGIILNEKEIKNGEISARDYDKLLLYYDEKAFPSQNGEPVNVSLQMYIEDMVPTVQHNMHYSVTMYFRQFWKDFRLSRNNLKDYVDGINMNDTRTKILSWEFSKLIWSPDLYFPYGKKGKRHDLIVPNILIRLGPDGSVFYSQRLSITSFCQMDLRNYPFDTQTCEFPVSSYAYSNDHLRLFWNKALGGPIFPPANKQMGEYTFDKFEYGKRVIDYNLAKNYDTLFVVFHFKRNVTQFILKMYIPCILIVILSWVGFWIDYRSTPARVALGITAVLTMAILGNSIRTSVPAVSYIKSIDLYVILCFFYVFAALLEYAFVGITDLKWRKIVRTESLNNSFSSSFINNGFEDIEEEKEKGNDTDDAKGKKRRAVIFAPDTTKLGETHKNAIKRRKRGTIKRTKEMVAQKIMKEHRKNKEIHYIDRLSRYVFPITFTICNIIYFAVSVTTA